MVWWRKLIATAALLSGGIVFLTGWGVGQVLVGWLFQHDTAAYDWAVKVADVAWGHPMVFCALLLSHITGLAIGLAVSQFLFRKTTMGRRVRKAITLSAVALSGLDVAVWLLVPFNSLARQALAPLSIVEAALFAFMLFVPLKQMWLFHRPRRRQSTLRGPEL